MVAAAPAAEAVAGRAAAGKAASRAAGAKKAPAKATGRKSSGSKPAGGGGEQENLLSPPSAGTVADRIPGVPKMSDDLLTNTGKQLGELGRDAANKVTLTPPKRLNAGDASGFALGLVLYCLFINYMKYGPPGVRGWISAKFVNKPLTGVQPK